MIVLIVLFVCIVALALLFEGQRRRHRRYRAEQLVISDGDVEAPRTGVPRD